MGKKGRRGKKSSSKSDRKEELQQRRQRQLVHDGAAKANNGSGITETLYIGDRVWYRHQNNTCRGFIQAVPASEDAHKDVALYHVTPVELDSATGNDLHPVMDTRDRLRADPLPFFSKFDVHDRVACYVSSLRSFAGCRVTEVFPIFDADDGSSIPCYCICRVENSPEVYQVVNHEDDRYIQRRPDSFRFAVGEKVVVTRAAAVGLPNNFRTNDWWVAGTITRVEVFAPKLYAAYECEVLDRQGRVRKCLVKRDTDEYLTCFASTPRERLFDAIKQQCSYEHISLLIRSFKLDVMSFLQLVIDAAIQFASYGMLLWLQGHADLELRRIRDGHGNTILHRIVKSDHAERFFLDAGARLRGTPSLNFDENLTDEDITPFLYLQNKAGRTFVDEIIMSGNSRLLQAVTWPGNGFVWIFSVADGDDDKLVSLQREARRSKHSEIVRMLDEHRRFSVLRKLFSVIEFRVTLKSNGRTEERTFFEFMESELSRNLLGDTVMPRLVSYSHQLQDYTRDPRRSLEYVVGKLANNGASRTLELLCETVEALLDSTHMHFALPEDRGEFRQPELLTDFEGRKDAEQRWSLVDMATAGRGEVVRINEFTNAKIKAYQRNLQQVIDQPATRKFDVKDFVGKCIEKSCDLVYSVVSDSLLQYKMSLLEDHESLEGRLDVLDYLVKQKRKPPPSPVDVIRWRSCGVLRWLVLNSFVHLERPASKDATLVRNSRRLPFMSGVKKIPTDVTIGVFLCMVAVEYDDLQSLLWLLDVQNIPLDKVNILNWNLVHLCAKFGRMEIALTLRSRTQWKSLMLAPPCGGRACDKGNLRVVHLAVENGYVDIANLLLSCGCPPADFSGRGLEAYRRRSPYDFVKLWRAEREKPEGIIADLDELFRLLSDAGTSDDALRNHLERTNCLSDSSWCNAKVLTASDSSVLGFSFRDILVRCRREASPSHFLLICVHCSEINMRRFAYGDYWSDFWDSVCFEPEEKRLDVEDVKLIADRQGDGDMRRWLAKPWSQELKGLKPDETPIFKIVQEMDDGGDALLTSLRGQLLWRETLCRLEHAAEDALEKQIVNGQRTDDIVATRKDVLGIRARRKGKIFGSIIDDRGRLELDYCSKGIITTNRSANHFYSCQRDDPSFKLYFLLAMEGYTELIHWALGNGVWSGKMEIQVTRVAAWKGHLDIVRIFTREICGSINFLTPLSDRIQAAVLGAVDGARLKDLNLYVLHENLTDQLCDPLVSREMLYARIPREAWDDCDGDSCESEESMAPEETILAASFSAAAVHSYLIGESSEDEKERMMQWLVQNTSCTPESLLLAAQIFFGMRNRKLVKSWERIVYLFDYLLEHLGLDIWRCIASIGMVSENFLCPWALANELENAAIRWVERLCELGLDIQDLSVDSRCASEPASQVTNALTALKEQQLRQTNAYQLLKHGGSSNAVIESVESGSTNLLYRSQSGMTLCHLAAAYDQLPVLQLLVEKKSMSLEAMDERGRTVLEVAEASGASNSIRWIKERKAKTIISNLLSKNVRRYVVLQRWKKMKGSVCRIQSLFRMCLVWKRYRGLLLRRMGEKDQFEGTWGTILIKLNKVIDLGENKLDGSWPSLKAALLDIRAHTCILEDDVELEKTAATLNSATLVAIDDDDSEVTQADSGDYVDVIGANVNGTSETAHTSGSVIGFDNVRMTAEVMKWLRVGDSKYIEFFKRKVRQLAAGESSRTLRKPLQGCRSKIYETYLEQVSGHRILWTADNADKSLVIWYVAKHKAVSKLARLIDDARNRSRRQQVVADGLLEDDEQQRNDEVSRVMLNPFAAGNSPLKLYEMRSAEIDDIGSPVWRPRLHLTDEERDVVEGEGSVLLLGRSGTGKTLCICNRMDLDWQRFGSDPSFSQLFVSRSNRLRKYVKEALGVAEGQPSDFQTFDELIKSVESSLSTKSFTAHLPSQKMDFRRFRRDVYREKESRGLDALVVWTNIRSFIKGSVEALQTPDRVVSKEDFISMKKFGTRRCRLTSSQRETVYKMFDVYHRYMRDLMLWDDCDRISQLLVGLEEAGPADTDVFESLRRSKIYVDEIQDYTQAEILLFFYLSGPGDLFLAGDPAQSVVEGVEFRFEEVRSVGHFVAGDRRDLIPSKPKTVNVNFRSHSGVLNTAAAILRCLFRVFPDSAKQLGEDRGVFLGPRPGVIYELPLSRLKAAVAGHLKGAVVLTRDGNVAYVRRALGDYPLVYGIREAKGLEFQRVILLDFLCDLPKELQKAWRDMLLGRDTSAYRERYPEVEGQLKMLYTAVTRCIEQLFIIESTSSVAGNAFVRWVTTKKKEGGVAVEALAERCSIETTVGLTPDQLRSMGFDHAISAEENIAVDLGVAERHLETALFCFESAKDQSLSEKVRSSRIGVRFRRRLVEISSFARHEDSELEMDFASLVSSLISSGLWSELRSLLVDTPVLRLLPKHSEERLRKELLPKLP